MKSANLRNFDRPGVIVFVGGEAFILVDPKYWEVNRLLERKVPGAGFTVGLFPREKVLKLAYQVSGIPP
jgi:hypothetical protein